MGLTKSFKGKVWAIAAVAAMVFMLLFDVWAASQVSIRNARISQLLTDVEITHQQIEVERNQRRSLESVLNTAKADNNDLLQVIASLEARPPDIKYIVETEVVIKPSDPIIITPDLPQRHLFQLEDSITVARFEQVADTYEFETYPLKFKGDLAISEKKTAMLFQVESGAEPNVWHELPLDLTVTHVKDDPRKKVEPHIGLAVVGSVPTLDVSAAVWSTVWHPSETVDSMGVYVGFNSNRGSVGFIPVAFNIGEPLPVLTDLWLMPGVSVDTNLQTNVDLMIGTKF